jgi:hypothetical protein
MPTQSPLTFLRLFEGRSDSDRTEEAARGE